MIRRFLPVIFVLLVFSTSSSATSFEHWTWYNGHRAAADSCIIELAPDVDLKVLNRDLAAIRAPLMKCSLSDGSPVEPDELMDGPGWKGADVFIGVVRLDPTRRLKEELAKVLQVAGVVAVWPNYIHEVHFHPNDPYYSDQGNFKQIYVDQAWDIATGQGTTVAVIDTGYRQSGIDDKPKHLLAGYDLWDPGTSVQDYIGHGTHISNTIAENTNNGIGCAGIAYNASIMPLKVFPDYNEGALENDIIDAINWANSHGADVINMSLGGGGYVSATQGAINNAFNNDIVVFAASGNSGTAPVEYPAAYNNCIAVGSTNRHSPGGNPTRSDFSTFGADLDLMAPGVQIAQETWDSSYGVGYYQYDGTSCSVPHASAVAALLISHGGPDAAGIRDALFQTASNNGSWSQYMGYGEIDAYAALIAYGGPGPNQSPVARIEAHPQSGAAPLTVSFDGSTSSDPDGQIESYLWTLLSTSATISHKKKFEYAFDQAGSFKVRLMVIDDQGASDTNEITINVTADNDDDDTDVGDDDDTEVGGDDSDLGDDPCAKALETVYYYCDLNFLYDSGRSISADAAYAMCQADEQSDTWQCLLNCYDQSADCTAYRDCATNNCSVEIGDSGNGGSDGKNNVCGCS